MSFRDLGIIEVTVFAVLIAAFLLFFILFVILRHRKQALNNRRLLRQRALMEEAVQKKVRYTREKNDAAMRQKEYETFAPQDYDRMPQDSIAQESGRVYKKSVQAEGQEPEKQVLPQSITETQENFQNMENPQEADRTPKQTQTGEGMRNLLQNALESEPARENSRNRARKIVRVRDSGNSTRKKYELQEEYAQEFSGRKYNTRKEYEEGLSESKYEQKEEYAQEFSERKYDTNQEYYKEDKENMQWDIPDDADFSAHSVHSIRSVQEAPAGRKSARSEETLRLWDSNSKSMRMAKRSQQDPPFFVEERRISHRRDQLKRLEEAK